MTLIDGDRIITAQLYDDEYEEYTEKKMSVIEYINAYTDDGVTEADVVQSVEPKRKFIENVLETLREMDDAVDVICNLDVDAVLDRIEVEETR